MSPDYQKIIDLIDLLDQTDLKAQSLQAMKDKQIIYNYMIGFNNTVKVQPTFSMEWLETRPEDDFWRLMRPV